MINKKISLTKNDLNKLNQGKTIELFEFEELDLKVKIIGIKQKTKKLNLVDRLQKLYDDNSLSERDEIIILDTIEFLGGKLSW
jgi:hypothetical protein